MSTQAICLRGLVLFALLGTGCSGSDTPAIHAEHTDHADSPAPADLAIVHAQYINDTFQDLYPIFLRRRSMPLGEKSSLWGARYLGRYVRWTGTIRSFTPNGVTLKHLPSTITFDVSLWLESDQLPVVRRKFRKGDSLSYIARLDSYDDIFRTMYLGHGLIDPSTATASPSPPSSSGDAGSAP